MGGYRQLHDLLRLSRLTAAAHSDPGFEERLRAVRQAVRAGSVEGSRRSSRSCPAGPTACELRRQVRGGALVQQNGLPGDAFDALLERVIALVDEPWDATVMRLAAILPSA